MSSSPFRSYIREITFGLEDSFVSTVGAVTGIAAGAGSRSVVVLAGLVIIVVEATSMAAGSYLSSKAARDIDHGHTHDGGELHPALGGLIMGVSYMLAGLFPLIPYLLFSISTAVFISIPLTLFMLFATGVWQTRFTKRIWWKSGGEMLLVGGLAIALGTLVGLFTKNL